MKKKIIIIFALVIISTLFLSGCNEERSLSDEEKRLVGTWKGPVVIGFFSDGTCHQDYYIYHAYGVWKIKNEELEITWIDGKSTYGYELDNNDIELSIYEEGSETPTVYRRQ